MIASVCCVCGAQYRTTDDNQPGVRYSHGYCPFHFSQVMRQAEADAADENFAEMETLRRRYENQL